MNIDDFDSIGTGGSPEEAEAELDVDADAVLVCAITPQGLQLRLIGAPDPGGRRRGARSLPGIWQGNHGMNRAVAELRLSGLC